MTLALPRPGWLAPKGARVILADPPWSYNDRRETRRDNPDRKPKFGLGVERRYSAGTMSAEELCALGPLVADLATPDAYCFMWATCPLLPQALEVLSAWGFRFVTVAFVWVKTTKNLKLFFGPGRYTPANAELVLLGVRGRPWHSSTGSKPGQVVLADEEIAWAELPSGEPLLLPHPRGEDGKIIHSRKPAAIHEALESWLGPHLDGAGLLEVFATEPRDGWICAGHAVSGLDIREELKLIQFERSFA